MTADPALRACNKVNGTHNMTRRDMRFAIAAAREALTPLRARHRAGYGFKLPRRKGDRPEAFCEACHCEVAVRRRHLPLPRRGASMTTPNLEQIIADHRIEMAPGGYWNCHCGINVDEKGSHAAHVVAVIRDSGLTVIALPEADDADDDGSEWWVRKDSIVAEDGGVSLFAGTEPMGADNAAELGAAILAAAQVAERNNP